MESIAEIETQTLRIPIADGWIDEAQENSLVKVHQGLFDESIADALEVEVVRLMRSSRCILVDLSEVQTMSAIGIMRLNELKRRAGLACIAIYFFCFEARMIARLEASGLGELLLS
jgi:anti-anti-sigma regulatory factor